MQEAVVTVTGTLEGFGNKKYKDSEGRWVDQRVAVFPTDDPSRKILVTPSKEDAVAVEAELSPLTGDVVSVVVSPGNYGKLWFVGLA